MPQGLGPIDASQALRPETGHDPVDLPYHRRRILDLCRSASTSQVLAGKIGVPFDLVQQSKIHLDSGADKGDQPAAGQRYLISVEWIRPTILFRLACYFAAYIAGLYLILQMAAIADPDRTPLADLPDESKTQWYVTMRSSRDTAYFFGWTFLIFPIYMLMLKRKGQLFPAKPILTVISRR